MDLASAPTSAALRFAPVEPPRPRPWTGEQPLWRLLLQLRRNALVTWGAPAYELDIVSRPFLGRQSFLLNDPEAIRRVLVDNHANYGRTPATVRILHPMIGDGLFLAEGERWKRQRRAAAPAFAPRSLEVVAEVAVRLAATRLDALQYKGLGAVDLLGFVQHLTLEVAGEALFSQSMTPHAGALRAAVERYGARAARPGPLDFVLPAGIATPRDWVRRRLGAGFARVVEAVIAERAARGTADPPRDLFDLLAAPVGGEGFAPDELRDQIATLIIAGHETTALALFWSLWLLTLAPDVQEAVAAEADAGGLAPENAQEAAARLPLARAVVQEALRLYPPAFTIVRAAREADTVCGREVPPGSLMVVAPWVLHRHRKLWREPDRFDPTRFLPGAPPPQRFSYLPFGVGPRVCIGAQFALLEAAIVLSETVRRYRIATARRGRVLPVGVVTIYPDHRPPFRLERRA
ncbi:cytochrome P450 [Marinimicrococcus flavescens]|uniref:Cytochrome P450 n=1 Tax=Marinimicrococcus flavescens TaxID=3031815 RepID=A0AAP3UYR7_9PROT|nr:cytochrome P450 [Marinimicrococcus flavescens]